MTTQKLQDEFIVLMKRIGEANFNQYRGHTNIDWNGIRSECSRIRNKLLSSPAGAFGDNTHQRILTSLEKLDTDDSQTATICTHHRVAIKQFRKRLDFTSLKNSNSNTRMQCWNNIQSALSKQNQLHELLQSIIKKRNLRAREKGYSNYIDYSLRTISRNPSDIRNKLKGYENQFQKNPLLRNGIEPFDLEHIICIQLLDKSLIIKHRDKLITRLLSQMRALKLQRTIQIYSGSNNGMICLDPISDIRLLLAPIDDFSSYKSAAHEYGHAYYCNTYDSYQSYLFESDPIANEMHAMFFERAAISSTVLSRSLKLRSDDALSLSKTLSAMRNAQMRSFAATADFCMTIYENDNVDYAREYAVCCRKYLNMKEVDSNYDFITKINIASNPIQYLSYAVANLNTTEQIRIVNSNKPSTILNDVLQKAILKLSLS